MDIAQKSLNFNMPQVRSVLITGGTRGIGKSAVYAFANAGFRVAFCYKNSDELAANIVHDCQTKGQYVCAFKCDVSNFYEVKKLELEVKKALGFIDALINNVGISQKALFLNEDTKSVAECFFQNFNSVFNLTKVFSGDMLSNGFGRVINVSSVFAKGASMESIYASSKSAVEGLTRSLAKEFAYSSVTVNAIAPGIINTNMNNDLSVSEKQEFVDRLLIKRMGTAEEVADAMLFLASENAGYITGQVLNINGGFVN